MPFDGFAASSFWEDNPWGHCRSCKRPIAADEPVEYLEFDRDDVHAVHQVNGAYHAACARLYVGLVRALEAARIVGR